MQAQALHALSSTLLSDAAGLGARSERRQVPVPLSMSRLAEILSDETKRTNPRDMVLRAIEASFPKRASGEAGDVLKQAIELKALVLVVDVRSEADLIVLKSEALVEELLTNRLILIAAEDVVDKAELPAMLYERCVMLEVATWGLFLNDARCPNYTTKQLLLQMRPSPGGPPSHYERVSALHLSAAQIGKDAQQELLDLLKAESCILRHLDVSNTQIDGAALVAALATNKSLTSLDVRKVPKMDETFATIGETLLAAESTSQLAYLRCDMFEVLEGEVLLSLRERPMGKALMALLTGLLRNNRDVQELDLAATCLQKEWALALLQKGLAANPVVTSVNMPYNPAIDEAGQRELLAAVEASHLKVGLLF